VDQGIARARLAASWRPRSVPEQLGVAGLGAAGAAVAYQLALGGEGLWLPCPLRALTGVPCPLCGMTSAATGLAAGDLGAAMAARALGWVAPPAQWPESRRRQGYRVAGVLAAASWAFQLHRFGWV